MSHRSLGKQHHSYKNFIILVVKKGLGVRPVLSLKVGPWASDLSLSFSFLPGEKRMVPPFIGFLWRLYAYKASRSAWHIIGVQYMSAI